MGLRGFGHISAIVALCSTMASVAQAEVGRVRIGLQFGLSYLTVVVAQSEGLIAKRAAEQGIPNLEVDLQRFSGGNAMNEAILSNSIDFGAVGMAAALIIWEKTRGRSQVKSLTALASPSYLLMVNNPRIKSLADFTSNDKIAVPAFNSPQAILLRVAAARLLGDQSKANALMANLPHPDATASLLAGTISGYFATPPYIQMLERDKRITTVLTSRDLLGGKDITGLTLIGSQGFIDDNPKVARAIMAGIEDATRSVNADPRRAAAIYLKSETVQASPDEIVKILTDGSLTFATTPVGVLEYAKFMADQGLLKRQPESWKDIYFPLIGDRSGS